MTEELLEGLKASELKFLEAALDCFKNEPKNALEVNLWLDSAEKVAEAIDRHEGFEGLQPYTRERAGLAAVGILPDGTSAILNPYPPHVHTWVGDGSGSSPICECGQVWVQAPILTNHDPEQGRVGHMEGDNLVLGGAGGGGGGVVMKYNSVEDVMNGWGAEGEPVELPCERCGGTGNIERPRATESGYVTIRSNCDVCGDGEVQDD